MQKLYHDRPNTVYRLLAQQLYNLAEIGATDKELKKFLKKGKNATLRDIAEIEINHTRFKSDEATLHIDTPDEALS